MPLTTCQINGKIEADQSLTALATAIFQDDSSQLAFEQLQTLSLEHFSPYWIPKQIPPDTSEDIRKRWLAHTLRDMKQEAVFRELAELFRSNGIRFCPIKGANLAWRVYPAGALRPKCDLDILLPEQEIPQALPLLKANGWTAPYRYRHSHHFPQMHKNHVALACHLRPSVSKRKIRKNTTADSCWDISASVLQNGRLSGVIVTAATIPCFRSA